MPQPAWRVELEPASGRPDPLGDAALRSLGARGLELAAPPRSGRGFLLPGELDRPAVETIATRLLADTVGESVRILPPAAAPDGGERTLIVRRMAGVADPEALTATRAIGLLGIDGLDDGCHVETYRSYRAQEEVDRDAFLEAGQRALANPVIEETRLGDGAIDFHPPAPAREAVRRELPVRTMPDQELARLSAEMSLALTLEEMQAVQAFYREAGRDATDIELETLAQTWSEHCKHKTLTGPVHFQQLGADGAVVEERRYRNLLKETVFAATMKLSPDWCWSVFRDNAGVIALTDEVGVAIKVETHNHPSALDPYGGAGTGIGGVIRDILGTGLGARPFAATDVFCVGPEDLPESELPPGTMSPDRILEGVIAGVRDYGNRMGIPTVAGTVLRHPGYVANPLVFAGCVGEIPRRFVDKAARPGDLIVALGGRTGRDGIHGATFSSEALHEESETIDAAAVQIGDPITEKKVLDVLLAARDAELFTAVTDCGAGGFSSAVGEMGEEIGAEVDLERAPLKYPGLAPWEVWISEAQERMVAAIDPASLEALEALCATADVELTVLGRFTDDKRLVLRWHGEVLGDLPMDFLHGGVPQPERQAVNAPAPSTPTAWPAEFDAPALLTRALDHPSLASKEPILRQYDHEVQGGTVVKPYQGADGHGPGDGSVLQPNLARPEAVALGCGIAPAVALLDAYAGTACAIDEAMRNVVAAGGNPHRTALLDNFCWGDCRKPDRFGSLVRAAEACHDAAMAFGTPFISGKDSLNNEYRVGDEERAIPPTLLCTAMAVVEDVAHTVTTPLKEAGNLLVLVGATDGAGGGSVAEELLGLDAGRVPMPDLAAAPAVFSAVHEAIAGGLVRAAHDLSEGGLAASAAEMVIGADGRGAVLDAGRVPCREAEGLPLAARLFSETPTRFLLEVAPDHLDALGAILRTIPWALVGNVDAVPRLELRDGDEVLGSLDRDALRRANRVPA